MRYLNFYRCKNVDALSDVCALYFRHERGHFIRPETERNIRDYYKITLIDKGEGVLFCNETEFRLSPGKLFLSHPNDRTSYRIDSEYLDIFDVIFKKSVLQERYDATCELFRMFSADFRPTPEARHIRLLDAGKETGKLVRLMYRESQNDTLHHATAVRLYLQLLLIQLQRAYAVSEQADIADEMTTLVAETIDHGFSEPLDFRKLAAKAGVSREHLGRVYRNATGMTISQALKRRRLDNAEELLKQPGCSISEAAARSGFHDLSYFFRTFKKEFHLSPSEYRDKHCLK